MIALYFQMYIILKVEKRAPNIVIIKSVVLGVIIAHPSLHANRHHHVHHCVHKHDFHNHTQTRTCMDIATSSFHSQRGHIFTSSISKKKTATNGTYIVEKHSDPNKYIRVNMCVYTGVAGHSIVPTQYSQTNTKKKTMLILSTLHVRLFAGHDLAAEIHPSAKALLIL